MQKLLQKQENIELILKGYLDCSNSLLKNASTPGGDAEMKLIKGSMRFRQDLNLFEARVCINYKTTSIYAKTKQDCIKKANAFYRMNYKKIAIEYKQKENEVLFVEWIDNWFNLYKKTNLRKTSLQTMSSAINKHIKPYFKNEKLNQLTALKIDTFLNKFENTRKKETISTLLGDCLGTAYKKELIKKPLHQQMTKYKHNRSEGHCLTIQEEQAFVENVLKVKNGEILYFTYLTGCRKHGALNFLSKDVDFENKLIHIRETKTKTSDRFFPLTPKLEEFLKKQDLSKEKPFCIADRQIKKLLNEMSEACGYRVNFKDLRTTFATRAREKGVSPEVLKKWLGHTSYDITEKYYVKITSEFEQKQIALLT